MHAVRGDRAHGVEASRLIQHELAPRAALRGVLARGAACAGSSSLDAHAEAHLGRGAVSGGRAGRADPEDSPRGDLVQVCALEHIAQSRVVTAGLRFGSSSC